MFPSSSQVDVWDVLKLVARQHLYDRSALQSCSASSRNGRSASLWSFGAVESLGLTWKRQALIGLVIRIFHTGGGLSAYHF